MNAITGSSAFLTLLEDEGIDILFGNPGTTELPIMNALKDHPNIRYIMGLQESIVIAMADGYARSSGKLAACNVHVAPGLGNGMGAIYNANWFGSPIIITAGQQEQGHGLMEPLLYGPLVEMAKPLVKWAIEVTRLEDLPRILRRAAKIALTPPTGPVFISLPGDILNTTASINLGHPTRVITATQPVDAMIDKLVSCILNASRPVILCGHEIATSDSLTEAAEFAETIGAPVYQQTTPYGAHFLSEHNCFMGALTRDQKQVREILTNHDLLICIGTDVLRMSVYSKVDPLPDGMEIIQLGLRDWEMGKNYPTRIAVRSDLKVTLPILSNALQTSMTFQQKKTRDRRIEDISKKNWEFKRTTLTTKLQHMAHATPIAPNVLMHHIADAVPDDVIVVDEALVSSRALLSLLPFKRANDYFGLASGGIGFAAAGVIGIHLANPERPIIAIIGDGSAMYSIQALWTVANMRLPITYIIANNHSYRILKERLIDFHNNSCFIGMDMNDPPIDFAMLATSMGIKSRKIDRVSDVIPAIKKSIGSNHPNLLEIIVSDGFQNKPAPK